MNLNRAQNEGNWFFKKMKFITIEHQELHKNACKIFVKESLKMNIFKIKTIIQLNIEVTHIVHVI